MADRWRPLLAAAQYRPPAPGDLVARDHAVWRVLEVVDLPLTGADRELWLEAGMPDLPAWKGRPCVVALDFVAGARPAWAPPEGAVPGGKVTLTAQRYTGQEWRVYPSSGRWPACSCCGDPMPCRTELQDEEVGRSLEQVEEFSRRLPGCCWACEEPISSRQRSVTYPGDNLDLPGGHEPHFHTRSLCRGRAERYELRWIATDPRRERILTYPLCGGILVVHGDGSTECQSGRDPMFDLERPTQRDCDGHLTHDHAVHTACYLGGEWFARTTDASACPRGCVRDGHPGTRTTPRPDRRPHVRLGV